MFQTVESLICRTSKSKFYSVRALKCYLNEKNLIHGRVTATISKFSPQIFETYFRLYGRLTARENYTAGSSIFCKLYLRVFDFLSFILQGPQFCKNYTLGLSKIGLFLYFRVRGKAQHSDPPSLFIGSPPRALLLTFKLNGVSQPILLEYTMVQGFHQAVFRT